MRRAGNDSATLEQARDMIDRQIQQMVRLVDDLLDVSRITKGKLELRKQRVELSTVIQSAVETSRPLIEALHHTLTITLPAQPLFLEADPIRLAQVFANLLNNAAKYTEHGGRIWLTTERQGSDVVVSVRDTGMGIPREMLSRVFEMFTQVDRTLERAQGGLGIGLTLVQRLTQMHGGTIEVQSAGTGQGSEFTVRLPLLIEAAPASPANGMAEHTPLPAKYRILVVDDSKDSAESMSLLLRLEGQDVQIASDGLEAVAAAERFRPDVVLLDIGLPRINGYEAARRIREQAWGQSMFLIAVTGWGQEDDRRRAKEAGFDQHLTKPVDPATVLELLATLPTSRASVS
jgi:CheY-like chemotaxis protein/two-component sensor histidine kinase